MHVFSTFVWAPLIQLLQVPAAANAPIPTPTRAAAKGEKDAAVPNAQPSIPQDFAAKAKVSCEFSIKPFICR